MATTRVKPNTKKEDERLRKELENADIGKFKQVIKSILAPAKKRDKYGRKGSIG